MDMDELNPIDNLEDLDSVSIPDSIPILPLRDMVVYPSMVSPLIIARLKSVRVINKVMKTDRMLGLIAQKLPEIEDPEYDQIFKYGTVVNVLKKLKFPDGSYRVLIQGLARFKVIKFTQREPYLRARIRILAEEEEDSVELKALVRNISNQFQEIITLAPNLPDELQIAMMNIKEPGKLADLLASNLNLSFIERQEVLETLNLKERLNRLSVLINRELQVLRISSQIQDKVQSEFGKNQREFYLREQLKAIQNELGEFDDKTSEVLELNRKIKRARMPEAAQKEAFRELERLSKMAPGAAEYTVSRTYIDWMISLPWNTSTEDNMDIIKAKEILDEDHYDLEKVKERILEYLSVKKLKDEMKGPILCFIGPPGVGKTSLGRSIARALNRKFVRISLGGVHDEAEIRGHRRTYIGSLPGRIIQNLKVVNSNNPVFMMDEVDKIGKDFRGDPASALLEVLDPEQNHSFSDHYLDVPFDLSKVLFITTANYIDPIPPALKDRMETLELPGYTEEEKVNIAVKYLIPKQRTEHGLMSKHISFRKSAIQKLITEYTREAGLRNLEREVASICRKVARKVAEGETEKIVVTKDLVQEFLGAPKFFSEIAERTKTPGIAIGLAWTPSGGDILFIESGYMKGQKGLTLTGQLGDVMKESAQAALSYIRSKSDKFNIEDDFFEKSDIHIHVPAGSIPKDGPSAGVTLVTSLVSLLTRRPVRHRLAMTGEITLRGRVLPVGGVKEKVLAARRAGIKHVILPERNKKDLEDVPDSVKKEITFHFADQIDDVIKIALT